jgi:hypothetical protein
MKFELNKKEVETLEELKKNVVALFGEVGDITFSFNNGGGIGRGVKITFEKYKITKDITDYESW